MFRQRYAIVERDRVSRCTSIVSYHWFRWSAEWQARQLTARHARAHDALRGTWYLPSSAPRLTWEVRARCA